MSPPIFINSLQESGIKLGTNDCISEKKQLTKRVDSSGPLYFSSAEFI
jgi:hypothetical protein